MRGRHCYGWYKQQEINMGNLHRWNCDCDNKLLFLPEIIPVHFAGNGVADDFGNKIEIFLMPILLLAVTILSGIKSIKYVLMHSKTWLTVGQYNLMIDCVLGIILIAEIFMIYASFV